ncbi:hypothetical protein LZ554_002165 [Drepanopeziza brunnea f. sp. 'monogermtubi']|nr:hypothetical protein LZ554_002165 [Drepanopeziza brunnea f. sp. 'monogermtubi']
MSRFYRSQVPVMKRMIQDSGMDEETFNRLFMTNMVNAFRHRHQPPANGAAVTFDVLYYLAEKHTWAQLWPQQDFLGVDPRRGNYESRFLDLLFKAVEDGTASEEVQRVWMRCLEAAIREDADRGMEVVQYGAEKAFWEVYWGDTGGFEGVDPRGEEAGEVARGEGAISAAR